ncbi:MAG: amino acid adenylation domain-containing protein [Neomegalonema sp.]|nr:amino acid adenylation domain-containing protein [Neomegalonema sp.]
MSAKTLNMIEAAQLCASLARQGIDLRAEGAGLKVSAPKGAVTAEIAEQIRRLKPALLVHLRAAQALHDPIPALARDKESRFALGQIQRLFWVHQQFEPETLLYNLPAAWILTGPLNQEALEHSVRDLIARHEVLRARFSDDDGTASMFIGEVPSVSLPIEEFGSDDPYSEEAEQRLLALRDTPFNMAGGSLFKIRLMRLREDQHILFFMPHHVIWDGVSFDILLDDLSTLYAAHEAGVTPDLPPLPVQFADFTAWETAMHDAAVFETEIDYWRESLTPLPDPLSIATDKKRPRSFSHEGGWRAFDLGPETVQRLHSVCERYNATGFMVFLAIWQAFLNRLTGQSEMVIGCPTQTRWRDETLPLVGCFGKALPLRSAIDPAAPLSELIQAARRSAIDSFAHANAPLQDIMDRITLPLDPSRTPLFQTLFSHQQVSRRPRAFGKLELTQRYIVPPGVPTDLAMAVMEGEASANVTLLYPDCLFEPRTIARMAERFENFIIEALRAPETRICDLPLLLPGDLQLLSTWNETSASYDREALAQSAFEAQAERSPDRIAVTDEDGSLSYQALDALANRLAHLLIAQGVGKGSIVGLHLPRGSQMLAACLAVWKAGGAYLPLDPEFPPERLVYMVEDSQASLVLSHSDIASIWPASANVLLLDEHGEQIAALPDQRPDCPASASDRAYILYTSGSTGRPKGVENAHRALVNFLTSMIREPGLSSQDVLLAVTTMSFDISLLEQFAPLHCGAHVVIASSDDALAGYALADLIEEHEITFLQMTPSGWRLLLDCDWEGRAGLKALCGGEALPPALAEALLDKVDAVWNMYGPTETTVWSSCEQVRNAQDLSIGRPIANTSLYALDPLGQIQPPGLVGELAIGGEGLAIGYLGRSELTAERFIPDPSQPGTGARVYLTGDLGRWRMDGRLEVLGRKDSQIKLRGYRIELGEIEAALGTLDGVAEAAAVLRNDASGEDRLIAYLVPQPGAQIANASNLRRSLRAFLPDYMIPQLFETLEAMPKTANRKIDRKALPDPSGMVRQARSVEPPKGEAELLLAALWSEALGVTEISRHDNFFELGGTSLQVAQMVARARAERGLRLSPRAVIFETLEQLASGLSVPA